MTNEAFEQLVREEAPGAVPEKFRDKVRNVAFLVEDEPSPAVRQREGLRDDETLLGLYQGVPATARGDVYGLGGVLPDTITLFRLPIEEEALDQEHTYILKDVSRSFEECVRKVVRETVWHEVAHYFGMDEHEVRRREEERDS